MDLSEIINSIMSFSKGNPIVAVAAALLLVFLIYLRPKFFLSILFLALLLGGIFYMITSIASTGSSQKGKLIQKGSGHIEER